MRRKENEAEKKSFFKKEKRIKVQTDLAYEDLERLIEDHYTGNDGFSLYPQAIKFTSTMRLVAGDNYYIRISFRGDESRPKEYTFVPERSSIRQIRETTYSFYLSIFGNKKKKIIYSNKREPSLEFRHLRENERDILDIKLINVHIEETDSGEIFKRLPSGMNDVILHVDSESDSTGIRFFFPPGKLTVEGVEPIDVDLP